MRESCYWIMVFVLNHGEGADLSAAFHHEHVSGVTVMPAKGSISNSFLAKLGMREIRKDLVFAIEERERARVLLPQMVERFKLVKKNRGIAYALPITGIYGSHTLNECKVEKEEGEDIMWQVIYTVVDKGGANVVIESAGAAGARGGTILRGRGSASRNTTMIFDFPIEPEKEVVMVLAPQEKVQNIVDAISDKLHIDAPGHGIIFVQDVAAAYGLVEQK